MLGLPAPGENPMRNEYSGVLGEEDSRLACGELAGEVEELEGAEGPLRS